ncbi:MAG TPA: pectinesterase family protein [Candidatus Brocadiia bacterium]|nr:pectinesterase family protein [Candidatus Brocadiia bacterium]
MRRPPLLLAAFAALAAGARLSLAQPRVITVAADGSGAFRSVQEAIDSVKDATRETPVDIVIKPGEYFGMATTKDWVNLVGEDRDKCVLVYSRKPEEQAHRTHVLWATTNTAIRNLTLIGKDVKYCIHSDGGRDYVLTVENCRLARQEMKGYRASFGIGLHANQHIILRGCVLEPGQPIYIHNWNNQRAPCSMTIENCELNGQDEAICVAALGSGQRDFLVIHDTTLKGGKTAIRYVNMDKKKPPAWKGGNEMELWGSGNKVEAPQAGAEIKDDSAQRLSGLERCRLPAAEPAPAPR